METHVVRGAEEVMTKGIPPAETVATIATDEDDGVTTEPNRDDQPTEGQRAVSKGHRRTRQRKSFTMDDDVYKLLGELAKQNGTNRSAFIEQLILLANGPALAPQVHELLGVMATRAGMTRTQFLEMLVLKAETVVNWKPPRLRSKPWWKPWARPEWEEPTPLVSPIVEAGSPPQLPGNGR